MALSLISIAGLFCTMAVSQIDGPFMLPARLTSHIYPVAKIADCTPPFATEPASARVPKVFSFGSMQLTSGSSATLTGNDSRGLPWAVEIATRHGGCWMWRADLDKNGREDLILLTSDATSSGESILTLVLQDETGRPVPWEGVGHYQPSARGLANLVDLDGDGRAELLHLLVEGIQGGRADFTVIHRYAIRNARLFRAEGVQAGTSFPIVTPRGLRSYHAPF